MIRKLLDPEFVSPEEMAMLQRVFDAVCTSEDRTSEAANRDGLEVFRLYRSGFRDEGLLLAEMQRRKREQDRDSSGATASGR
jgi:hypothetical protein